jgi:hypothetical protein
MITYATEITRKESSATFLSFNESTLALIFLTKSSDADINPLMTTPPA